MKFLKQGLCLALLGAGLAAAPTPWPVRRRGVPSSAATAAPDQGLVQGIRRHCQRDCEVSPRRAATGAGRLRPGRSGGDLLPGVAGDSKAAAAAKADAVPVRLRRCLRCRRGRAPARPDRRRRSRRLDRVVHPVLQGRARLRRAPQGPRRLRRRPHLGQRLRRARHRPVDRPARGRAGPAARRRLGQDPRPASTAETPKDRPRGRRQPGWWCTARSHQGVAGKNLLAYVMEVPTASGARAWSHRRPDRQGAQPLVDDRQRPLPGLYETRTRVSRATNLRWTEGDPFPGTLNADQQNLVSAPGESYWFFAERLRPRLLRRQRRRAEDGQQRPDHHCPNANWNGVTTNYCNGVTSDDVVAHEWGHAYTEYTSGLIYQWQSGALNESYSDIWGETLDLINGRDGRGRGRPRQPSVGRPVLADTRVAVQVV